MDNKDNNTFDENQKNEINEKVDNLINEILDEENNNSMADTENVPAVEDTPLETVENFDEEETTEEISEEATEESVVEEEKSEKVEETPLKKKKTAKIIIISVVVIILAVLLTVGGFLLKKFMLIEFDEPEYTLNTNEFVENPEDKFEPHEINDAKGDDFKEILKAWSTNGGEKLKDENIINILLIGSDASVDDPHRAHSAERGNTDAMIIMTIDKTNKKIKLTSVMRDSFVYLQKFDRFTKLNAACANGGPGYLVHTIEDNFKIAIDGYALVDIDSFKKVIDILGGINVDVPQYVANYVKIPAGKNVKLNGEQAFKFAQVRHSDANGDISRVSRQRQVINSIITKCKGASLTQINDIINVVFSHIRTNLSRKDVFTYAASAVTNGWAGYEISEMTMPIPEGRTPYNGASWIWIIDYPLCAQKLQEEIYGKTNIVLEEDRETAITVMGFKPQK